MERVTVMASVRNTVAVNQPWRVEERTDRRSGQKFVMLYLGDWDQAAISLYPDEAKQLAGALGNVLENLTVIKAGA